MGKRVRPTYEYSWTSDKSSLEGHVKQGWKFYAVPMHMVPNVEVLMAKASTDESGKLEAAAYKASCIKNPKETWLLRREVEVKTDTIEVTKNA